MASIHRRPSHTILNFHKPLTALLPRYNFRRHACVAVMQTQSNRQLFVALALVTEGSSLLFAFYYSNGSIHSLAYFLGLKNESIGRVGDEAALAFFFDGEGLPSCDLAGALLDSFAAGLGAVRFLAAGKVFSSLLACLSDDVADAFFLVVDPAVAEPK